MIESGLRAGLSLLLAAVPTLASGQPADEVRQVAGLRAPAEIRIDRWGIAHIYAGGTHDAFFLQGYNAARDRLWQIDLWRKRGLGLLAADFGPAYVEQDRAARLVLYRGSMAREWAAYGTDARRIASAFVAGINAYVDEVNQGRRPLPIEFRMRATRPALWRAEDVVRIRSHALSRNLVSEVARAQVACRAGLEADTLRQDIDPPHRPAVPDGLDPCAVPPAVLGVYRLAVSGVNFAPSPGVAIALEQTEAAEAQGSNAWAVAATRTVTGRPILASDPHRQHGVPSLRYLVHLETPAWSVIGAGEPSLPGISIGHNGAVAFGLTIFSADQEDLYVYELDPADPRRYRYRGGWERMRRVRETIAVRGEAPRVVDLLFTRHGPVLHAEPATGRAFALRTVWSDPGASAYFGAIGAMTALDGASFADALGSWGMPSVNQIYADRRGTVGGRAVGRIPVRSGWDGLMPVPGDGRYEWGGYLAADQLPDPFPDGRDWVASANEMNLPAGTDAAGPPIGYEWPNAARSARISSVLDRPGRVSLADMIALQTDSTSGAAGRLLPLLSPLADQAPDLAAAIGLLASWDGRMEAASPAAAIFETWLLRHLGRIVVARLVPESSRDLFGSGNLATMLSLIEQPDARFGPDPGAARNAVLIESLRAALADLGGRLGPDMRTWAWGRLHHALPEHPLAAGAQGADAAALAFDRLPLSGGYLSPLASGWRPQDFRSAAGASLRVVIDVGAWDESRAINAPGQSGDPLSPHFRDHYPLWAVGDYVPLLYSREAVVAATEQRLRLEPATNRR
jgi:penicillin amidase